MELWGFDHYDARVGDRFALMDFSLPKKAGGGGGGPRGARPPAAAKAGAAAVDIPQSLQQAPDESRVQEGLQKGQERAYLAFRDLNDTTGKPKFYIPVTFHSDAKSAFAALSRKEGTEVRDAAERNPYFSDLLKKDPNPTVVYFGEDSDGNGVPDAGRKELKYDALGSLPDWDENMAGLKAEAAKNPGLQPIVSLLDKPLDETLDELHKSKRAFAILVMMMAMAVCGGCFAAIPFVQNLLMIKTGLSAAEMSAITAYAQEKLMKHDDELREKLAAEIQKQGSGDYKLYAQTQAEITKIESELQQSNGLNASFRNLLSMVMDSVKDAKQSADEIGAKYGRIITTG